MIEIKKIKGMGNTWIYSRFKQTDNKQLNDYFSSIQSKNSYQLKKYFSKSASIDIPTFKSEKKFNSNIPQMVRVAQKVHSNMKSHGAIEKYFIENDPHTVATELPVRYKKVGGLIDIFRYKDGVVQILDYKIGSDKYGVEEQLYKYKVAVEGFFDGKILTGYFTEDELIGIDFDE